MSWPGYPQEPPPQWPHPYYWQQVVPGAQIGCICPPGANKECQNPTCPRKPVSGSSGFGPST